MTVFFFAIPVALGSAIQVKLQMGYCGNTFPKEREWRCTLKNN
jgi:hypothetical protein